jgi:hypothetical protein
MEQQAIEQRDLQEVSGYSPEEESPVIGRVAATQKAKTVDLLRKNLQSFLQSLGVSLQPSSKGITAANFISGLIPKYKSTL